MNDQAEASLGGEGGIPTASLIWKRMVKGYKKR